MAMILKPKEGGIKNIVESFKPCSHPKDDLTSQTFDRLTVQEFAGRDKGGRARWKCKCIEGNIVIVDAHKLKTRPTNSCGCLWKECITKAITKHSKSYASIYNIHRAMIDRCTNPKNKAYHNYGAKGIVVCQRWLSFENFYADVGDPPKGMTLERKDNLGNYEPTNVRWATIAEQNRNKSTNVIITYNNKTQCLTDWAKELGFKQPTLSARLIRWKGDVEKAFTTPIKREVRQNDT